MKQISAAVLKTTSVKVRWQAAMSNALPAFAAGSICSVRRAHNGGVSHRVRGEVVVCTGAPLAPATASRMRHAQFRRHVARARCRIKLAHNAQRHHVARRRPTATHAQLPRLRRLAAACRFRRIAAQLRILPFAFQTPALAPLSPLPPARCPGGGALILLPPPARWYR